MSKYDAEASCSKRMKLTSEDGESKMGRADSSEERFVEIPKDSSGTPSITSDITEDWESEELPMAYSSPEDGELEELRTNTSQRFGRISKDSSGISSITSDVTSDVTSDITSDVSSDATEDAHCEDGPCSHEDLDSNGTDPRPVGHTLLVVPEIFLRDEGVTNDLRCDNVLTLLNDLIAEELDLEEITPKEEEKEEEDEESLPSSADDTSDDGRNDSEPLNRNFITISFRKDLLTAHCSYAEEKIIVKEEVAEEITDEVAPELTEEENEVAPELTEEEDEVAPELTEEEDEVAPESTEEEDEVAPELTEEEDEVAPELTGEEILKSIKTEILEHDAVAEEVTAEELLKEIKEKAQEEQDKMGGFSQLQDSLRRYYKAVVPLEPHEEELLRRKVDKESEVVCGACFEKQCLGGSRPKVPLHPRCRYCKLKRRR